MRFLMTVNGGADTGAATAHRAIEAVRRIESATIIAGLAGLVRDVGLGRAGCRRPDSGVSENLPGHQGRAGGAQDPVGAGSG